MDTVLWVDFHQEVDVCWHDFKFEKLCAEFSTDALDNLFKPGIHPRDQHGTAILRTPDNMVFAGVDNVVIRFVLDGVL